MNLKTTTATNPNCLEKINSDIQPNPVKRTREHYKLSKSNNHQSNSNFKLNKKSLTINQKYSNITNTNQTNENEFDQEINDSTIGLNEHRGSNLSRNKKRVLCTTCRKSFCDKGW